MCEREYTYLFTMADLSIPQKIVQVAHAAAYIGNRFHADTNVVLCEESNLEDIAAYLDSKGIEYELFFEPDVNAFTSLATQPLKGSQRRPMRRFRLMK